MDQCLTKYERPKKLYFVLNFSRTLSGKIQRKTTIEYVYKTDNYCITPRLCLPEVQFDVKIFNLTKSNLKISIF